MPEGRKRASGEAHNERKIWYLEAGLFFDLAGLSGLSLPKQTQTPKVLFRPADIREHPFQCTYGKRAAQAVIGDDHAPPIGVPVDSMTASSSHEPETISVECMDESASGDAMREAGHRLTATAGVAHSSAPCSGSKGIGSPVSRRSST